MRLHSMLNCFAAVLLVSACARPLQVPMQLRPDTRHVIGAELDTITLRQIVETFARAYPHETGVCLPLALRDTVIHGAPRLYLAEVTGSREARIAAASDFWVRYDTVDGGIGCPGPLQLARGHSHPHTRAPLECTHSHPDAYFLASDPRVLFSLVFCGDGRGEILWQDGRRVPLLWQYPLPQDDTWPQ